LRAGQRVKPALDPVRPDIGLIFARFGNFRAKLLTARAFRFINMKDKSGIFPDL